MIGDTKSIMGQYSERKGFVVQEGNGVLHTQWIEKIDGKQTVVTAAFIFAPTPELSETRMVLFEKKLRFYNQPNE